MIKAEDLRIGDLVQHESHVLKITGLHNIGSVFTEHRILGENELTPIPITTEILEKNGFEEVYPEGCYTKRIDTLKKYIKKFISIKYDEYPTKHWKVFIKYYKYDGCVKIRNILYIHELQHILWALGEDANLTI